jgi:hypothetical protein
VWPFLLRIELTVLAVSWSIWLSAVDRKSLRESGNGLAL